MIWVSSRNIIPYMIANDKQAYPKRRLRNCREDADKIIITPNDPHMIAIEA